MSLEVLIDNTDIFDYVAETETISRSTSYPYALETQPSTVKITLNDPAGYFSPNNAANFFVGKTKPQNGKKTPIIIRYNSKVLFNGEVDELFQNADSGITTINCIDLSYKIRESDLTNFGLEKQWKMIRDTNAGDTNGVYPLTSGVTPLSKDSISGESALNTPLNIVDTIRDAGVLNPKNVAIDDNNAISEGGAIPVAAGSAYPQMTGKSPYRYKYVSSLIADILSHYGINSRSIQISPITADLHFTVIGRPGYENVVGKLGSSNHLGWYGYVTDYLVDGNTFYFAYSVNRGQSYRSRIIKYDRVSDAWDIVYNMPLVGWEVWGLAKIGNNLIILTTNSSNQAGTPNRPTTGSYDSNVSSKVSLVYIDITAQTPSIVTLVSNSAALSPQLAHFYQVGSKIPYVNPIHEDVALPDTRRRLLVYQNELYYGWAKSNKAGLAKVAIGGTPTKLSEFNSDGINHCGFCYSIHSATRFIATTFYGSTNSTLKAVRLN